VRLDKKKKLKMIKRIWLALFIILIMNNIVADTIAFAQPSPGPNPFFGYLPELVPLGYLLAGVLFVLGIIAYRKDFSYAILLISAAALVAGLLNYSTGVTGQGGTVLKVQHVTVNISVYYNGQPVAETLEGGNSIGSFQAPTCQPFYVYINTDPPVPITNATWYIGNTILNPLVFPATGKTSFEETYQTSTVFAGTNTIIVEVSDIENGTLYYGYAYVVFRYVPTAGTIYTDVMDALMVVSGISGFAAGEGYYFLSNSITNAINNFVTTPPLGGSGANGDAASFYNYFQDIAISIGFVLIALGIGINALRGGYSDLVDLGMDFFYRTGVFLLFAYGGMQIYNAIANSLNMISQYIVSSVIGEIANTLAVWTELALGLLIGSNFIGFGFGRSLTDFSMFLFEIDTAIFAVSYIRVVLIFALASLIPLIVAMWTFEWTRGIALALAEILAGLVFGGIVDALILYFAVQVSGLAFFFLAPFMMLAYIMVGWGAHQVAKSVGHSVASRSLPSVPTIGGGGGGSSNQPKPQNVPNSQLPNSQNPPNPTPTPQPPNPPPSNQPTKQLPNLGNQSTQPMYPQPPNPPNNQQPPTPPQPPPSNQPTRQLSPISPNSLQQNISKQRIGNSIQDAIKKLGKVSTIRLNDGDKYVTVTAVQGGYRVTKGIRTEEGAVEKSYNIPGFASIEKVAQGVEKNYFKKSDTVVDLGVIGQFFKSIEGNNGKVNNENVKITSVRTNE